MSKRKRDAAKVHVNLRVPDEVLQYFKQFPNYTAKMREVLADYVSKQKALP